MAGIDCTVREARLSDAPAIANLVTQLGYPVSAAEMAVRLSTMLPRADYVTFVAEAADVVVGLVGAYLGCALEFTEPYGRLTGLVVDEQWRGRGIGSLLLAKVEGWLSGKGASLVTLTSGKHRIESHVFYGKLGYEETGLRFAKRL